MLSVRGGGGIGCIYLGVGKEGFSGGWCFLGE